MKLLNLLTAADELKSFAEGDIDVQQPQATEGTTEIGVIPQVLKLDFMAGEEAGEMIQGP